jgi:glucokinase
MLLAADIGGTKTEVAAFSPQDGPRKPVARRIFPSGDYPSLEAILREFLDKDAARISINHACLAVAGPVIAGEAKITNLTWTVELHNLERALQLPHGQVTLINDLQAIALAVPVLHKDELVALHEGDAQEGGAIAVVAPGTGMGMAFLTWDGSRYQAHASEGGHADFAPGSDLEIGLFQYLHKQFPHVSVERVCSGKGLPSIYDYLREINYAPESPEVTEALAQAEDRTPIIVEHAVHSPTPSPLCVATLDIFIATFGAAAGNLALNVLSTGGVYLAGGIPPRIVPALQNGRFMEAFLRKGRLSDLLAGLPVHVILSRAALLGAAAHGLELIR